MTAPAPAVDLLFLPTWVAIFLYLVTIPLGVLVGALALRGFGRSDRRTARLFALGLLLLTSVDALLGLTIGVGDVTVFSRVPGIVREVVQLLGVACILYAIYVPTRRASGGRSVDAVGTPSESNDSGGDGR